MASGFAVLHCVRRGLDGFSGSEGLLCGEDGRSRPAQGRVPVVHALQLLQLGASPACAALTLPLLLRVAFLHQQPGDLDDTRSGIAANYSSPARSIGCAIPTERYHVRQEDSCCTDPHRWMKPLVCPQDFLENDVCALHFVGWRKSGMPAVYKVFELQHRIKMSSPIPTPLIPLSVCLAVFGLYDKIK